MNKPVQMFNPIRYKRIFEEISDQIRASIIKGIIKPGDKLPSERELSLQFKSGRMVVREALRILEHSGFIYIRQGSEGGAFVKDLNTDVMTRSMSDLMQFKNVSLENLVEARLSIEKEIMENLIDRITNEDLELLNNNIKITSEKIDKGQKVTKENLEFHMLLAKSIKNPIFEMMIQSVLEATKFYILKLKPKINYVNRVLDYHIQIYDAVKEKNKNKAKRKMVQHIKDVNKHLSTLMVE